MKNLFQHGRKLAVFGALGCALLLSACSSGTDTTNGGTTLPAGTSTATSAATGSQGSASSSSGFSQTITYASIETTILTVDQQNSFSDDSNSSGLLLRVNIKEKNTADTTAYAFYSDNVRLLLPGGKSIAPSSEESSGGIDQAVVRNNWLDFAVASKQDVNTLVLRFGGPSEHQMDVPLSKNPDLSKYQIKTITPGTKLHYGVDWTITKVTSSLSADAKQAKSGKRYIVISLSADNTTSDAFYPFPTDNFRLKNGGVSQAPESTTLPGSFAASSTGGTGTITFLMPDGDPNFILDFLAQKTTPPVAGATATFQI